MLSHFSNPLKFEALARRVGPVAFIVFVISAAVGVTMGLFFSPQEKYQLDSVRIMYVHVPAAYMALAAYTFIAVMSLVAFIWRHSLADISARTAAVPGAAFTALALFTGAVWGKPTWGVWWAWDARLTAMLFLLIIYLGYIVVWQAVQEPARAARFARILALVGFLNIPIIKFSVDHVSGLHQKASIVLTETPAIPTSMLIPLFAMIIAYTALFTWLVFVGVRAEIAQQRTARQQRRAPSRPVATAEIKEAT